MGANWEQMGERENRLEAVAAAVRELLAMDKICPSYCIHSACTKLRENIALLDVPVCRRCGMYADMKHDHCAHGVPAT